MKNIVFLIIIILLSACGVSDIIKKRDIIKKEKFINILIDIHKADGLIEFKKLQQQKKIADSVSIYNFILKKHGVSRSKFKKTVDYYTVHNKEYIEIYDSVESYFNKIEKELSIKANKDKQEELKRKKLKKTNLWKMKKEWALPEDGKKNTVNFKIITSKQGKYSLSAKIKIYPDDLSKNPKMTITANYSDGTKDTKYEKITEKDGKFHNYEVYIKTNIHKKLNYISGKVLDHDKNSGTKHAHIKDISLKITNNNKIILK